MAENAERKRLTLEERVAWAELVGSLTIPDAVTEDLDKRAVLARHFDNIGVPLFVDELDPDAYDAIHGWMVQRPTEGEHVMLDPTREGDED